MLPVAPVRSGPPCPGPVLSAIRRMLAKLILRRTAQPGNEVRTQLRGQVCGQVCGLFMGNTAGPGHTGIHKQSSRYELCTTSWIEGG